MERFQLWRRYAVVVAVGLGLALAQVWTRLQVVSIGSQIASTQQLIRSLEGERQALELQWSTVIGPGRLASQAATRLGMGAPQPEQIIPIP
jgi:cell division protein FtsL